MLWVLKRTVLMRRFFRAPITYVQTDGLENNGNFALKAFAILHIGVIDLGTWCHVSTRSPIKYLPSLLYHIPASWKLF